MFKATTIVAVKNGDKVAMAGDGQVTYGENTIMKSTAKKIKKIYNDKVLIGFAGSVADAFALSEMFEEKLGQHGGNLKKAAVDLASAWRSDKALRKLEALLIAADKENLLIISGGGEIIEPDDNIAAIGSGGMYALSAARALSRNTNLGPSDIARESLKIASEICIYTNSNIIVEEL
ncbi:MAG TPA: HslU--HslV peptidase proteolytic subunit [Clostridiaceae bacterium]|jgi:ATP-dependent HslUV protease subunit HslV|nr:HslU--HslV peptidase proteolytic subunit [Clostridiaceae bacterium]HBF76322.1 HslU--HslV peptidase proteolytic subunit [Clostridiaceae bacterium]HBG39063.1 HslU--HslV peptidase proteolytic subunit [Clostridiaceae bacterium]HBN27640.1 HslU--HslV peptidase proteolytic subunit [Clostridiaceae bacterium]HBX49080.1 HslU--HslV peptidase proteolytic subunit [Clostridiaceae bacterium]